MTTQFYLDPPDIEGDSAETNESWYVKEGDYIHCICPNREVARLIQKELHLSHNVKKELSKQRNIRKEFELNEAIVIATSELAVAHLKSFLKATPIENISSKNSVHTSVTNQKKNSVRKKSKLDSNKNK
ncbi:hypothetical protein G9Q86_00570 [Pseudomonas sp. CCUG 57209]|uniref:hypothetical protein n=1 Tax=Pseudomonas sivasensis TaxID=1880678 RepID=UPI0015EBBA3D|nr:hypothetical protein [Pseudomonas sivasensis]MBA2927047.1 hypothetical protein [Pseudomonas sivasensis]